MSAQSKKVRAARREGWSNYNAIEQEIGEAQSPGRRADFVPWRGYAARWFWLPLVAPAQGSRKPRQPVYYPDRSRTVDAVYHATTARTVRPNPTLLREYRVVRLVRRIADAERLGLHTLARVLRVTAPHGLSLP